MFAASEDRPSEHRWSALVSLFGALLWAVLAAIAGAGIAPLGVIELLLLFAALVIVPLGLEVFRKLLPAESRALRLARLLQPVAAIAAVISLCLPPGHRSGGLVLPWVGVAVLTAVAGALNCSPKGRGRLVAALIAVAGFDFVLASGWLLISRLGLRPMNFQEPILRLTAIHFHYTGFATALIAASLLQLSSARQVHLRRLRATAVLIALLPFAVAAGFTFYSPLRTGAALALAVSVAVLARIQLRFAGWLNDPTARFLLRVASLAAFAGMALACVYVVGEQTGKDWPTIPRIASTHGALNGLGFVLLSLLGWLVESHSYEASEEERLKDHHENRNHGRNRLRWAPSGTGAAARGSRTGAGRSLRPVYPEFVAREFYDK